MILDIFNILDQYNLTDNSLYNIQRVLRSLFRVCKLKGLNAPKILFETEDNILKESMNNLHSEEIYIVVTVWSQFKEKMTVRDECDNLSLDRTIAEEMKKLD